MGRLRGTGATALSLLALGLALLIAAPVQADDGSEARDLIGEVKAHEQAVAQHLRDKAYGLLPGDIGKALELFDSAKDHEDAKKARARMVKLVGNLCRKIKRDEVRKPALSTLGKMHHADCAKYVKGFLKVPKGSKLPPVLLPAIQVAGTLGHDSLVQPLLKIVRDSKSLTVASRAVTALGYFIDASINYRILILKELTKTLTKDMPTGASRGKEVGPGVYIPGKSSKGGSSRYQTLGPLIPVTLNKLTGQETESLEGWIILVQARKPNLRTLFVEREKDEKKGKKAKKAR